MRTLLIARGWAHADLGGSLEYSYIKTFLGTIYHPMGTAAMLPRELGGKCSQIWCRLLDAQYKYRRSMLSNVHFRRR